jgi:hypothetical protein
MFPVSFSGNVKLKKDKNCFPLVRYLTGTIILSGSVGTFKVSICSIKY